MVDHVHCLTCKKPRILSLAPSKLGVVRSGVGRSPTTTKSSRPNWTKRDPVLNRGRGSTVTSNGPVPVKSC